MTISRTGDVSYAYELILPEKQSLSEEGYEKLLEVFTRVFGGFTSNTVIHKMDMYVKRKFDGIALSEKSYLQRTFKAHHGKKSHWTHRSYLFFTWTVADMVTKDQLINPFKPLPKKDALLNKLLEDQFEELIKSTVAYVNQSKRIQLRELDQADIEELCSTYHSGLLQGVYSDFDGTQKEGVRIGDRWLDTYTINSLSQLPLKWNNVTPNPELSEEGRPFYQGFMEPFGTDLKQDHMINQICFIPGHQTLLAEIKSKHAEFHASRGFGLNRKAAVKIEEYLNKITDNPSITLVRFHLNVMLLTATQKQRQEANNQLLALFTERDLKPYKPTGNALRGLFQLSFFPFSARLPNRFTFTLESKMAAALLVPTSAARDDAEGIYFNDHTFNIPLRKDTWDEKKRRIKARNFFIIAPTGQGKSTLSNHLIYQYLDQGYKVVVNDLGKSYQNLYRIYKDRAQMLEFKKGEPLGINPFAVEDPAQVTSDHINYLNEVINLLHFKGGGRNSETINAHNTCIRKILSAYYETADTFNMSTFYRFFEFLHKKERYEDIGIEKGVLDATELMGNVLFSLSEFAKGIYAYLFEDASNFVVDPEKLDFIYFEFDEAKDDAMLLALLQLYSYQATKKVIWENKQVRGIQLYDEFAKQLRFPQVAAFSEYLAQTIRKHNGACGFVIQSVSQLPENDTISSLLDNTSVFYILPTEKDHENTADRLKLPTHQRYLLNSIASNLSSRDPYTTIFLLIGKYAQVVRLQLPPEHVLAFQTEGELYNQIEESYKVTHDMTATIEQHLAKTRANSINLRII